MRLNTKGRYAVMAMADLAKHGLDKSIPMSEISDRQHISLSYLEQLFVKLRRAGLAKSMRGPGGGYALAKAPDTILISEIMVAVGEPFKITRCQGEDNAEGCLDGGNCITHDLWSSLGNHIEHFLEQVTLQDVLNNTITSPAVSERDVVTKDYVKDYLNSGKQAG